MSAPRQLPPPSNPALLPVLASVVYVAAVVAAWGLLSVVLDRDVIDYPDAGPLLGPAQAIAGGVVTWLVLWRRPGAVAVVIAGFGSYLGVILVGAIGYTLNRGDATWMLLASAHFALSPFVVAAAALSAITVLAGRAVQP
ncbi:MAG: DUF6121 family protein [Rhodoglobus sp.]